MEGFDRLKVLLTVGSMRDQTGRFVARPNSGGKVYGVRVRKDLDPAVAELAEAAGKSPTEWIRALIEAEIERSRGKNGKGNR